MPNPKQLFRFTLKLLLEPLVRLQPNLRGAVTFPPSHYHSPLLDIQSIGPLEPNMPFDGVELRPSEQRSYYEDLLQRFPLLAFPRKETAGNRYFTDNTYFNLSDAFFLSGIVHRVDSLGPRRSSMA
jgi:hypothetical protein